MQRAFGTDAKSLQVGFAVDAGIRAATLAAAGAQADPSALDAWLRAGRRELPAAVAPGRERRSPAGWPSRSTRAATRCSARSAPLAGLARARLNPAEVRRIVVRTPEATVAPLIHHRPDTGLQGKFSLEYAAAAALLDGYPGFASFTDEAVRRPEARRLAGLVETTLEPGGSGLLDGELFAEVHTGDGVRRTSLRFPPGAPQRPPTRHSCAPRSATAWPAWPPSPAGLDLGQRRGRPGASPGVRPGGGRVRDEGLSDEESAIVELVREFVDREVRPVVAGARAREHLPGASSSSR